MTTPIFSRPPARGRPVTDEERRVIREASAAKVMVAQGGSLVTMCEQWGVAPPQSLVDETRLRTPEELERGSPGVELEELTLEELVEGRSHNDQAVMLSSQGYRMVDGEIEAIPHDPEREIGRTGTPLYGGVLYTDESPRMQPYLARGFAGSLGQYHRALSEPLVYKSLQSIREFLVNGSWAIEPAERTPKELLPKAQEFCDDWWRALQHIEDGWEHFVHEAATAAIFGFSLFEVVWGPQNSKGARLPKKIAFREPDGVHRWIMNSKADRLVAVDMQTGGDDSTSYMLPAWGREVHDQRVLLNRVGGQGNNWEGRPPTRPIDVLIAKKKLLLTIEAATAERFGAPILVAMRDPQQLNITFAVGGDDVNGSAFFDDLLYLQAADTPTVRMPFGWTMKYVGPGTTAPDFKDQLEYLDSQIMLAFSNQGALLGQQSVHGSYALAKVQDAGLLRSAPYYARACVTRSLNQMIRRSAVLDYGLGDLVELPSVRWRMPALEGASTRIDDLVKFFTAAPNMPKKAKIAGLEILGLPLDTFDGEEDTPAPAGAPEQGFRPSEPDDEDDPKAGRPAVGHSEED